MSDQAIDDPWSGPHPSFIAAMSVGLATPLPIGMCRTCGALVPTSAFPTHVDWHGRLGQDSDLPAAR